MRERASNTKAEERKLRTRHRVRKTNLSGHISCPRHEMKRKEAELNKNRD